MILSIYSSHINSSRMSILEPDEDQLNAPLNHIFARMEGKAKQNAGLKEWGMGGAKQ